MKKKFTLFILFLCLQLSVNAQANIIADFITDYEGGPSMAVKAGNKIFFSAPDNVHGRELWVTDGTAAGTYMVKDINPGIAGSITSLYSFIAYDFNGILFFKASNGINGQELWRSDGTSSGTWMVKDLYADNTDQGIYDLAATDSLLFFTTRGSVVWRSNGTAQGTYVVGSFQIARNLATYKNSLYFSASPDNNGEELWKTNGATGATILLKDINGAIGASLPCNFHATNNALYFTAATNAGWELWKTTGTNASTVMVKDINPGGANGALDYYSNVEMTNIGNTLYFRANDGINGHQLWKTDGTDAGTIRLSALTDRLSQYCRFHVVNGKVLINSYNSQFYEQYDPATNQVSQTGYPFKGYFDQNNDRNALFTGTHLFYAGTDSVYGGEVWRSGGSTATTNRLQETLLYNNFSIIYNGAFNSLMGTAGSKLLFTQGRGVYDRRVPLFAYDTALNNTTAFAPSQIVPVPLPDNKLHVVWNRINGATQYQLRYKPATSATWLTRTTALTYIPLTITAGNNYDMQMRANVNGVWTDWGSALLYESSLVRHDYLVNILADRPENETTTRIYWLKTPEIEKVQIRYRPAGTATWRSLQNATGMLRMTTLTPGTFYEYQYRSYANGVWGTWFPSLHFYTEQAAAVTPAYAVQQDALQLLLAPNPAKNLVYINNLVPSNARYSITDAFGRVLRTGTLSKNVVDIAALPKGVLTITIFNADFKQSGKVIKE